MNIRAKKILESAVDYMKAANVLNHSSLQHPQLLLPSQVNASLSLELYFKSLYQLVFEEDFKVKGNHSHDFYRIYKALPDDMLKRMNDNFDSLIKGRDNSDIKKLRSESKVNISLKLESLVQNWSGVFTKIRYVYEDHNGSYAMILFPEIAKVVGMEIYTIDREILS
ncbi:hypothetical protein CWO01_11000 [Vibrio splendidus]|uniref:hypothetical protein n=1 Tax=Vibrio splendidus TaxID=29497 RepID=UPI000D34A532|nr:hypothetical protein [Vibrio splendidus]PTP62291.1 hypothetical protein CWO01_11000 [Vibrio splendidus]